MARGIGGQNCLRGLIAIFNDLILADELTILFIAMLPVFELRGAIPVALTLGMPPGKALLLGVVGSLLPAFPILLYLTPISRYLRQTLLRPLVNWALKRGLHRGKDISKYHWWGLFLFVALPFPSTGVWSGAIAASLLGLNLRQALPPIVLGTMVAGVLVVALAYNLPL